MKLALCLSGGGYLAAIYHLWPPGTRKRYKMLKPCGCSLKICIFAANGE
jgi:hypothetical protein